MSRTTPTAIDVSELHAAPMAPAATLDSVVAARAAGRQDVVDQLHNGAVQQLTAARWALSDGDVVGAMALVDAALTAVRSSVDVLDPPPPLEMPAAMPPGLADALAVSAAESTVVFSSTGVAWANGSRSLLGDPDATLQLGTVMAGAHDDDRPLLAAAVTAALSGETSQLLWRFRHPLTGWRHLSSRFGPLTGHPGGTPMAVAFTIDVTDEQARLIAAARADERGRIARDLHDDALQQLAGLRWLLQSAGVDGELLAEVDGVEAAVRGEAVRLSSAVPHGGLREALQQLAATAATPVSCEWRGEPTVVDDDTADVVWRAARELLRNVDRHAGASCASMVCEVAPDRVVLAVCDDGVGIGPGVLVAASRAGHLGVASLREVANTIGGTFELASRPEGGTRASLAVPLR